MQLRGAEYLESLYACSPLNPTTNSLKLTPNLGAYTTLYDCQNDVMAKAYIIQTLKMM